jgi:glycosyltransferase involved in cell wall biosynthesis
VRRVKVLTLTDQLIASGGAERVAMEIAMRLDRSRFESVFCASRYYEGYEHPSVQVAEQRMQAAGVRYFGLGRRTSWDFHRWLKLRSVLRREGFDVIHTHMFGSNAWGTVVGRLARTPAIVAHEHTWSFEGRPLRRLVDREVIGRGSSVFIAVSQADRRKMIEIEGVKPEKVLFVPNGIPTPPPPSGADVRAELGIPAGAPVIGSVSVLRPQKALDVFVRAAVPLLRDYPDLRVLIAGEGPLKAELTELVRSLGLPDRLMLLGYRSDVPDVLAALDVAVSSSLFEGSPLAVMEFMEAARPIVATTVGGVPDLIDDGVHGLLVPPADADALSAAIRRMLDDREAARAMGERARERRRREFDIDLTVRRFESLYLRLLEGAGPPASVNELAGAPRNDTSPAARGLPGSQT